MQIVEVRELDGPNLFLLRPAIKLEYRLDPDEAIHISPVAADLLFSELSAAQLNTAIEPMALLALIGEIVGQLHELSGAETPDMASLEMETSHQYAVAFSWDRRRFAATLARAAFGIAEGSVRDIETVVGGLRELLDAPATKADMPEMLDDDRRNLPIIAITGTNGKTTTTRLVASCLMAIGRKVGWTSSVGVMIQNEMVLEGDFTGPAGAARVFEEPELDIAVLETARGGILLRGLGYESNDVSVITNVTGDHLGLHGVHTVEGLRDVKSVIAQVTVPDGFTVLNAENELAASVRDRVQARVIFFAKDRDHALLREHLTQGGWGIYIQDGAILSEDGDGRVEIAALTDVPMTFGGRAPHMVENALAGTGALLAAGLTPHEVRTGLTAFRNESSQNRGRLNVFQVKGGYVILDFAHNPDGLRLLLEFGRQFVADGGRLIAIVGTAGDRTDDALHAVGELAAKYADVTFFKDSVKYLRGRPVGQIVPLMHAGFQAGGGGEYLDFDSERTATLRAIEVMQPHDVVALMCIEDYNYLIEHLESIGEPYAGEG